MLKFPFFCPKLGSGIAAQILLVAISWLTTPVDAATANFAPTLPSSTCTVRAYGWTHTYSTPPGATGESSPFDLYQGGWSYNTTLGHPVRANTTPNANTLIAPDAPVTELNSSSGIEDNIGEEWLLISRSEGKPGSSGTYFTFTDAGGQDHTFVAIMDSAGKVLTKQPTTAGKSLNITSGSVGPLNFTYPADGIVYTYIWIADYMIDMGTMTIDSCHIDFGDAPGYAPAQHNIRNGINLGYPYSVEAETASETTSGNANDDNLDDGVSIPTLVKGASATLTATVTGATGKLQGWIDFNGNGVFDTTEQIATNLTDGGANDTNPATGVISWTVAVPTTAITTKTFARFRWSTASGLSSSAPALNGEVEDYALTIAAANSPPVITSGGSTLAVNFAENSTATVTNINASDLEDGAETNLTYSLSGADASKFTIDANGNLKFKNPPDFETPLDVAGAAAGNNVYEVQVTVKDSPGSTDTQTIKVTVTDVDEIPPTLSIGVISSDDLISAAETNSPVVISGTSTAEAGQTVTVTLNGKTYTGTVTTGGTWSTIVPAADVKLLPEGSLTITAQVSDIAGNPATPANRSITKEQTVALWVRGILQGAYNNTNQLMRDDLRVLGLIPSGQPYASLSGYAGTETLAPTLLSVTGNGAPVDWVLVELRNKSAPETIVARTAALLQRDGDAANSQTNEAKLIIPGIAPDQYYVSLIHRNHLGVMTQAPVTLSPNTTMIDFSLPTQATSGTHARQISNNVDLLWAGDANTNNNLIANGPDNDSNAVLSTVLGHPGNTLFNTNFRLQGYYLTDLNLDGQTIFAGPDNEINLLTGNVLLHPGNSLFAANYIIRGTLPK